MKVVYTADLINSGFLHLGAGLAVGLAGLGAGYAIGIVGDAVRSHEIVLYEES